MQSSLSLSILCFGIYFLFIVLALRIIRVMSPTVLVCSCAVFVYIWALILISTIGLNINFFSFSSLYWFLTLSLLMVFGAIYKSISLRMMLHLLNNPEKKDFYDAIMKNYIKDQSYLKRISILLEKKMIRKTGNASFSLTKRGNTLAKTIWLIQKIFSIKESG